MGSWGVGIYSNDTALDVRDTCQEIFAFVSVEEGNKIIFDEYKELLDMNLMDDDYASFWYALADWQWKHGMLIDEIKDKTLKLLEGYTGLSEWEADASKATVKKRMAVLDKLKEQLLSPQPPLKKPKSTLAKPKHKPGDIVIFQSSDHPIWDGSKLSNPFLLYIDENRHIQDVRDAPLLDISFKNKYMVLLCVGSVFEKRYSRYLHIMDEHSVYAVYDYLSDEEPTLETLKGLGFLPVYGFNKGISDGMDEPQLDLLYKIYFSTTAWKASCSNFKKDHDINEYLRFCQLQQKASVSDGCKACEAEHDTPLAFIPKLYFERMGVKINTLIDPTVVNPMVVNYEEYRTYTDHMKVKHC